MIPVLKSSRNKTLLAVGICSLFVSGAAWSAPEPSQKPMSKKALSDDALLLKEAPSETAPSPEASPEKARALLDQVEKSEQDRAIAAKQTEIDRLKEDQTKAESDTEALKKTMESTSDLINGAGEHLTALTNDSRRLEHDLAVCQAWITAEQWKTAGLHALADAQGKSLSALSRRAEETAARSQVQAIELESLQAGQQPPREGHEVAQTDLDKARKALAAAEAKTESEERLAREAMKAAGIKMALAEAKATYAQRLADNDLNLEAAKATAKAKPKSPAKSPAKPAPVAAGPSAVPPKPPIAKPAAKTGKTPAATPPVSR